MGFLLGFHVLMHVFGGGVGSSASVFFCGWAISGFLACAVLVAVWGWFVLFLCMPLFQSSWFAGRLFLDSCLGVFFPIVNSCCFVFVYSCSGVFFPPSVFSVSSPWVDDVVVLPPQRYCSSSLCCTQSNASWCSAKLSQIAVFF